MQTLVLHGFIGMNKQLKTKLKNVQCEREQNKYIFASIFTLYL